jgi:hypothetical protein
MRAAKEPKSDWGRKAATLVRIADTLSQRPGNVLSIPQHDIFHGCGRVFPAVEYRQADFEEAKEAAHIIGYGHLHFSTSNIDRTLDYSCRTESISTRKHLLTRHTHT